MCSYVQHLENRIANLERLLREARTVPFNHIATLTLYVQHSGRRDGGDHVSTAHGGALTSLHGLRDQHNLRPLPASAYSKPEEVDPLSLLAEDTSDSEDEFFSLTEMNLGDLSQEPNAEHTPRFYGKSSLLAFTTRAFDERGEVPPTDANRAHAHREEFWTTPDVIPQN